MSEILLTWTLSLNSINQDGTCETVVAAAYSPCIFFIYSSLPFSTISNNVHFPGVTVVITFASMKIK